MEVGIVGRDYAGTVAALRARAAKRRVNVTLSAPQALSLRSFEAQSP